MPSNRVTFLPSLPAEGWASMNRYWGALVKCAAEQIGDEFSFRCPLPPAEVCTPRAGILRLAIEKKVTYPLRIRFGVKEGIAHVLDHSYAFLLDAIPAGVKKIVTVHDLLPLREPDGLSDASISRFRRRVEWVKRADLILSDSAYTKSDLIELIGVAPEKIHVLPLGADPARMEDCTEIPEAARGRFVFSIGGYMKRKNLEILPAILEKIRSKHPDVILIRAGGRLPAGLLEEFDKRCGSGALVEMGQVSEELLSALYRSAAVTLIPSFFEGFGLPVLEAMARGCPVVSSNATSLPEVGGDAALYFHPDDSEAAAQRVLSILEGSDSFRTQIIASGIKRAEEFTWDKHFEKLLTIYREIAAK